VFLGSAVNIEISFALASSIAFFCIGHMSIGVKSACTTGSAGFLGTCLAGGGPSHDCNS
jgi:hypothetical protein